MENESALIVIDVQNDFCGGGSLEVPKANEIIPVINKIKQEISFKLVLQTCDWHPANHVSFAVNHQDQQPFTTILLSDGKQQELWPVHCQAGTFGAQLHPDLVVGQQDIMIKKGQLYDVDSYSGFGSHPENTHLDEELKKNNIQKCFVVGLATDFCVQQTAFDSAKNGDWHPANHVSFAVNHQDQQPFTTILLSDGKQQELWPVHCQAGTFGAQLHPDLVVGQQDIMIKKGYLTEVDSYTGFGSHPEKTHLKEELQKRDIQKCFIVGLATDFCVQKTAFDSAKNGYQTYVVLDAIRGIDEQQCQRLFEEMKRDGIQLIYSQDVARYL